MARYLADESAGQCGPCVHGLRSVAGALESLARGRDRAAQAQRWLGQVRGRGACRHPDGTARFVACALAVFADEIERHLARCGRGRGGCSDEGAREPALRVNPIACDGNGLCAELFPERISSTSGATRSSTRGRLAGLAGHARRAVAACPVLALHLEKSTQARAPAMKGR